MAKKITLEDVQKNNKCTKLYEYIRGSHAYGLATETSDEDRGGVYICSIDELLGLGFEYQEQVADEKNDVVFYEIKKYLHLLIKSNPTALESLFVPEDCIVYEHPIMTYIKSQREKFLSKACYNAMVGFAVSQFKKMVGRKKLIHNPVNERLGVLDFCFVTYKQGSSKLKNWLEYRNLYQKYIALVSIPNMKDYYGAYYDWGNYFLHENISVEDCIDAYEDSTEYDTIRTVRELKEAKALLEQDSDNTELPAKVRSLESTLHAAQMKNMVRFVVDKYGLNGLDTEETVNNLEEWYNQQKPIGYCGIVNQDETSNEVRFIENTDVETIDPFEAAYVEHTQKTENSVILSSVPKNSVPICHIFYNIDGYSQHCKKFKEYQEWKENRNVVRYNENIENGCEFDRKNAMHQLRILRMAVELAKTGKFNIDRRNIDRDDLLSVRKGSKTYEEIMSEAERLKKEAESAISVSELPDSVDVEFVNNLLLEIRNKQLNGVL